MDSDNEDVDNRRSIIKEENRRIKRWRDNTLIVAGLDMLTEEQLNRFLPVVSVRRLGTRTLILFADEIACSAAKTAISHISFLGKELIAVDSGTIFLQDPTPLCMFSLEVLCCPSTTTSGAIRNAFPKAYRSHIHYRPDGIVSCTVEFALATEVADSFHQGRNKDLDGQRVLVLYGRMNDCDTARQKQQAEWNFVEGLKEAETFARTL